MQQQQISLKMVVRFLGTEQNLSFFTLERKVSLTDETYDYEELRNQKDFW